MQISTFLTNVLFAYLTSFFVINHLSKSGDKHELIIICFSPAVSCLRDVPRPLVLFVCQWDINHPHQRFSEERAIALSVVLLQNLATTFWAHRQNKSPTWLQLFQKLLMHRFK